MRKSFNHTAPTTLDSADKDWEDKASVRTLLSLPDVAVSAAVVDIAASCTGVSEEGTVGDADEGDGEGSVVLMFVLVSRSSPDSGDEG